MYLNGFTVFVILSSQCLLTYASTNETIDYDSSEFVSYDAFTVDDCTAYLDPRENAWPIPFTYDFQSRIMVPDKYGRLRVKKNKTIQLSCSYFEFELPDTDHETEISVTCIQRNVFMFKGAIYRYQDFVCKDTPLSRLIVTTHRCQNNGKVAAVGFSSKKRFFIQYNICFDEKKKAPMYIWYFAKSPYKTNRFNMTLKAMLIKSKQFYGFQLDVRLMYHQQATTLLGTLGSTKLVLRYFNPGIKSVLTRVHLADRFAFYYGFQQEATFYYENTVPIWENFYHDVWKHVQIYVTLRLLNGNINHLIASGTYGQFSLPDVNNHTQPLYLSPPNRVPVPKYIWLMDYDTTQTLRPLVFIGVNTPMNVRNHSDWHICLPTPCPRIVRRIVKEATFGVVYCCTKRSFESVYGIFHSNMFHKNLI